MSFVPLNDLRRSLLEQGPSLAKAFARVVDSGWLVHGPEHAAFQHEMADYIGVDHALGVASGTDALELAMQALTPGGGGAVVTAANAGAYATVAARSAGFEVRYCDVDPVSHLLDPDALGAVLDDEGAVFAVVVTHLYGRVADVEAVRRVCAPRGVRVIEDCAQAIGAEIAAGRAGSLADVGTFSFYPTKNLGALGDGGAVTTNDPTIADRVTTLRQYGWRTKYRIAERSGRNSRLDELQAAVLRYRLPFVAEGNARRREIIARYEDAASERVLVLEARGAYHSGHLAVCETEDAADLAAHLARADVGSDVHYPVPDHRQEAYEAQYASLRLPVTERLVGRILSLPCFPELTEDEIERVCRALATY